MIWESLYLGDNYDGIERCFNGIDSDCGVCVCVCVCQLQSLQLHRLISIFTQFVRTLQVKI